MNLHRLAEERSIAIHGLVGERLRADPALIAMARQRIEDWQEKGSIHPAYALEWLRVLALPIDLLCAFLVDPGEHARAVRQSTPFAGVIDPRTRWRVWDDVRRRFEAEGAEPRA